MTLLIFILRPPLFAIPILVTLRLTVLFKRRAQGWFVVSCTTIPFYRAHSLRCRTNLLSFPDGGVTRGTHVLKALSVGAKACSGGRFYLYALAAAGQTGVEKALQNLHTEIERDMKLMGCRSVNQLSRDNLRFR